MDPAQPSSCLLIDDSFGPHAKWCRGGFDFTLFFEETVLSILPLAILIAVVPLRSYYLLRKPPKTTKWKAGALKLVNNVLRQRFGPTDFAIGSVSCLICAASFSFVFLGTTTNTQDQSLSSGSFAKLGWSSRHEHSVMAGTLPDSAAVFHFGGIPFLLGIV